MHTIRPWGAMCWFVEVNLYELAQLHKSSQIAMLISTLSVKIFLLYPSVRYGLRDLCEMIIDLGLQQPTNGLDGTQGVRQLRGYCLPY